jgi:ATP-dependent Clp protease ATP-binding subunit ClpB
MDVSNHTQKTQEAILNAQHLAQDYGHQAIEPAHLLLSLLNQKEGVVPVIVRKVAGSAEVLRNELTRDLESRPNIHASTCTEG